jgi:hypothetical protein
MMTNTCFASAGLADLDIDILHDLGAAVAETLNCFCHDISRKYIVMLMSFVRQ